MKALGSSVFAAALLAAASAAQANDLTGEIESVNATEQSFVIQGINMNTDDRTDYDDGLRSFDDLKAGDRIEVDFAYRNGRHVAEEIERD